MPLHFCLVQQRCTRTLCGSGTPFSYDLRKGRHKTDSKPGILAIHSGGGFSHGYELGADSLHGRQRNLDNKEITIARPSGGECDRNDVRCRELFYWQRADDTKSAKTELLWHAHLHASKKDRAPEHMSFSSTVHGYVLEDV